MTLRRLDGSMPGNLKAILSRYRRQKGISRRTIALKRKALVRQGAREDPERQICPCTIKHEENRSTFVLLELFGMVVKTHYIFLRFRTGCKTPRNVDGRVAWTTEVSDVRTATCEVRVSYRPKDSANVRDEYVPLSSLDLCSPSLKEDVALVVWGADAGKILIPSHSDRTGALGRSGIYCKRDKGEKKKDAIVYALNCLTRARAMEQGPPHV